MSFSNFFKKFKKPPTWAVCLHFVFTLLAIAGALTFVFIGYTGFFSYIVYALAACTLGYSVYIFIRVAPKMKAGVQGFLRRGKFTRSMLESYGFRTVVFATCSLLINLGFVAFNTVLAVMTGNSWYGSLAGYYFLLSGLRGLVFFWDRRAKAKSTSEGAYRKLQLKNYGYCGGALLVLELAMAVAVTFMVLDQKPTKYGEIMAIVFATYSVYKISLAIWNIVKAKRAQDWQIQAFRNIGLTDAAVSLLSLQTTLVATFSAEGASMLALNAITGAFVCLLTIGIGIFMIVQAIKRSKYE